ncbi:concanavalin A-like lectin/glucanase domain-containing protein [Filobasidium floriforme]|uniref:concanavalin A-like lectin/glucanase domain-containing protein n=1 Tax=Filobasidium floriforme TaxID=5210 RepID=UPI001E8E587E|nr:concanavalin A-like lectin/glucanase domain-containing protein [Filobasidium floriforme]KAH8089557.1 concanavalin A-like lectin/glucanase domain-containing protein [Filobasidium floriforme]
MMSTQRILVSLIFLALGTCATAQRVWKPQIEYSGTTFFDGWSFFTDPDPSNGLVRYRDGDTAFAKGLAFWTQDGTPGIQADGWTTLNPGELRDSIRLHSKALFNGGLFIADFALMPWGCGIWPSFWTLGYGAVWPTLGEIDIVEGVQDRTNNQATIHSTPGCFTNTAPGMYSGITGNVDCDSTNGKTGCGILSTSNVTYGEPFNLNGGGVFAMIWDERGIRMWEFDRRNIPADISNNAPTPGSWGMPMAAYDVSTCDINKYFKDNQLVLTVNLCGDWAGGTYSQTAHCPGTCAEQVANPANLKNTIFLINSIKVYQLAGPDEIPPPVANIRDASKNAQGMGGGRVSSNETSVGQASAVDKGRGGGRGGAGGGGGGSNNAMAVNTPCNGLLLAGVVCLVTVFCT